MLRELLLPPLEATLHLAGNTVLWETNQHPPTLSDTTQVMQ
jgi:hypothetical protein